MGFGVLSVKIAGGVALGHPFLVFPQQVEIKFFGEQGQLSGQIESVHGGAMFGLVVSEWKRPGFGCRRGRQLSFHLRGQLKGARGKGVFVDFQL